MIETLFLNQFRSTHFKHSGAAVPFLDTPLCLPPIVKTRLM